MWEPTAGPSRDSRGDNTHLCNKSSSPQQLPRGLLSRPVPSSQRQFCFHTCHRAGGGTEDTGLAGAAVAACLTWQGHESQAARQLSVPQPAGGERCCFTPVCSGGFPSPLRMSEELRACLTAPGRFSVTLSKGCSCAVRTPPP